jgi:ZIP family zinc transporter
MDKMILAFLLTLFVGLTTVLGGFFAFFIKRNNLKMLSLGLGFSAGAMIYVSFMEVLVDSQEILKDHFSLKIAGLITIACFFIGILITALIDYFMPDHIDVKLINSDDSGGENTPPGAINAEDSSKLYKVGLFTMVAICVHKLPEGLATFIAAQADLKTAIAIAAAIAIHNIPEGVSIALPVYYSTGKKRYAIWYTLLAGLAEPLGALLGFLLFRQLFNELTYGIMFAFIAGIMIYISLDALLPLSREYGEGHISIIGVICGIFLMAIIQNFI